MSCTITSGGVSVCTDFIAGFNATTGNEYCQERTPLAGATAAFSVTTACPTASRIGRCTGTNAGTTETAITNYYAPTSTDEASMMCPPSFLEPNTTYSFQAD